MNKAEIKELSRLATKAMRQKLSIEESERLSLLANAVNHLAFTEWQKSRSN